MHLFVYVSVYFFGLYLSVFLSVYVFVCVCISVCQSDNKMDRQTVSLPVCVSQYEESLLYLSISLYLSVCLVLFVCFCLCTTVSREPAIQRKLRSKTSSTKSQIFFPAGSSTTVTAPACQTSDHVRPTTDGHLRQTQANATSTTMSGSAAHPKSSLAQQVNSL